MRVVSADGSIVFTGDATETEELLAAGQIQPGQVLKVSHHGSNASSSMPFLAAVGQLAIYLSRCGQRLRPSAVKRCSVWQPAGAQVRRTDQDKALKITFDGNRSKCYGYRYQKEFFSGLKGTNMEITAEKIMQQLSAGTQVAGVIAVFGEGYYKDKIAAALQGCFWRRRAGRQGNNCF